MAGKPTNWGCVAIFGLVFVLAGLVPGGFAAWNLVEAAQMRGWVRTEAEILSVELKDGDEGTSSVVCEYRYRAQDRHAIEAGGAVVLTGNRVGISGGSDNVGSWQQDTWRRLESARSHGQRVPCWYDPDRPSRSILDRELRWGVVGLLLLFPLLFGGAGTAVMLFALRQRRQAGRSGLPAEEAWRQRSDWASGRIRSGSLRMWIAIGAALFWNAISWTAVIAMFTDHGNHGMPRPVMWLFALFPLVGIVLAGWAVQEVVRRLLHGRPELRLASVPLRCGSRVAAEVRMRSQPRPGDRIEATLAQLRTVETGSSDERTRTELTEWSMPVAVYATAGRGEDGAWMVPLALALPADLPPWAPGADIAWRLTWRVVGPGLDLEAAFDLPVLAGPGDAPELRSAQLRLAAERADPLEALLRAGITVAEDGDRLVVGIPALRNTGLYVPGLFGTVLLALAAAAAWTGVGMWLGVLVGILPLLALRGALRSAFYRSRITVRNRQASIDRGWWRIEHDADLEVEAVEHSTSMSSGQTAYHNVRLRLAGGRMLECARGIPGPAVPRLVQILRAALLPPPTAGSAP